MEKKSLSNFCVIGFPDELGIKNVGGRLGASLGPASYLEAFQKIKGKFPVLDRCLSSTLVSMGPELEINYQKAVDEVARVRKAHLSQLKSLIVVGGGHDYAYPWIRGMAQSLKKGKNIGCLNIDAHFDLRAYDPVMTSGSPFRRLIDEKWLSPKNLIEFGIQEHCNGAELWAYAKKNAIPVVPFEKVRNGRAVAQFKLALQALSHRCDEVVISVDLDAMSMAFCPGVSAPQGEGFTGSELYQMLEIAGAHKKVTSLGIFELSPPLDHQNYTSRVAAQATWHFLSKALF